MAISKLEMLADSLFEHCCFNLFAKWHHRPWFKYNGVSGLMVGLNVVKQCS